MTSLKIATSNEELLADLRNTNNVAGARTISSQRLFFSLIIGFIIGFSLGYFLVILSNSKNPYEIYSPFRSSSRYPSLSLLASGGKATQDGTANIIEHAFMNLPEHKHIGENTTLADKLHDEIKILCWIMTMPQNHKDRAMHVKLTWGQRCNKLIFISTEEDDELPAIGFTDIAEGREYLWYKTRAAFTYVYENYLDDYDWFLKADDDTYVIMENLRFMLSAHSSDSPIFFGSKFQVPGADRLLFNKSGYLSLITGQIFGIFFYMLGINQPKIFLLRNRTDYNMMEINSNTNKFLVQVKCKNQSECFKLISEFFGVENTMRRTSSIRVYMSGGGGYILSKEAVKRLVGTAFKNPQICRTDASIEDIEVGVCLEAVGVIAGDSRDNEGKTRFHPLDFGYHTDPEGISEDFWLTNYSYYKLGPGLEYVSESAISFHYIQPNDMYLCEYLIYHIKPYGIWRTPEELPTQQFTLDEEIKILREAESDRNLID